MYREDYEMIKRNFSFLNLCKIYRKDMFEIDRFKEDIIQQFKQFFRGMPLYSQMRD